jgi:hypothetical protein
VVVILAVLALAAAVVLVVAFGVLASTHRPPSAPTWREPRQPGAPEQPPFRAPTPQTPEVVTASRTHTLETVDAWGRPTRETDRDELHYRGHRALAWTAQLPQLPDPNPPPAP